jgi:hypothetical protein
MNFCKSKLFIKISYLYLWKYHEEGMRNPSFVLHRYYHAYEYVKEINKSTHLPVVVYRKHYNFYNKRHVKNALALNLLQYSTFPFKTIAGTCCTDY